MNNIKITKTKVHDFKYTITGEYGYCLFEITADNVLILTFRDGSKHRKSLNIELTLPRVRQTMIEKHVSEMYHKIKHEKYNGVVPV